MNGALNKILASVIAGLLLLAAGGTYSVATQLASMEAKLSAVTQTLVRMDERVTYIERGGYSSR